MELRSVQNVNQIAILQTSETRLDMEELRAQKSGLFADVNGNLVQNERSASQTEESRENNNDSRENNKVNDFTALEELLRKELQELDSARNVALKFSLDKETKQLILSLIDAKSNEVIRQIPSELALKIVKFFNSKLEAGQVTDAKV